VAGFTVRDLVDHEFRQQTLKPRTRIHHSYENQTLDPTGGPAAFRTRCL
jgi:hypothetical protein